MKSWHLMKSSYIKSLIILCLLQQLTACFHDGDPAIVFDTVDQGSVSLTWDEPVFREDDSLLNGDIAGYRVYYGTVVGDYQRETDAVNPTVIVDNLIVGETYHFVVTAYDTKGRESMFSNSSPYTVPEG